MQTPPHVHARCQRCKRLSQRWQRRTGAVKAHAHKEKPGAGVVVLRGFGNVGTPLGQKPGDAVHNANAVGARQGEDVGISQIFLDSWSRKDIL